MESTKAYTVWTNSDLNEGRGRDYPLCVCEQYVTALRQARRNYIQGGDCPITEATLVKHRGKWYQPVQVITPSVEDLDEIAKQAVRQKKSDVLEKLRALGITQDEIDILTN